MSPRWSVRKTQIIAAVAAGILAGAVLLGPAGAHVTRSVKHLFKHLDPRYVNADEVNGLLDPRYVNTDEVNGLLDPRYVNTDETSTRHASCAGLIFLPGDNDTGYANNGSLQVRQGATGSGVFRCNPALPDGAVVTEVAFSVADFTNTGEVGSCNLARNEIDPASAIFNAMASAGGTGVSEAPGFVRLTTSTISFGTVDTEAYGYWLECTITASSSTLGIYGASVTYTITGAEG